MITSKESLSWYNKVDETWKSVGVNPDVWASTPTDYKVVCKTIKALWKKEMGKKIDSSDVVEWIKIIIVLIIGTFLIGSLISTLFLN